MSTNTTNSTDLQTSSSNSPEQSNRGNRHYNNDRRQRGGRPYRPHRRYSNPREPPASGSQTPRDLAVTSRTSTNLNDLNDLNGTQSQNESICFICAGPVQYFAVSECNHRLCHLCSLRLRALYENKNCAYCKTEQIKVIFTRKHDKEFQKFEESDIPYFDENLNAYCEDQEMFDDIKLLLKYNCPGTNCDVSCEGWSELKRHIRKVHHLMICDVCIRHKKIFSHEQSLFTQDDLDKHYLDGDEETGFKGHPYCQFCRRTFYGDDELFEHCRDKHEQCFICMRAGIRHHYYCDYNSLEQHFRKEHYLCQDQECLEKKFVVFETDIDLKAHEVSLFFLEIIILIKL
ncbi:hypothetical protein C1645_691711 [Glomus cerebriforme]|uniref:RING-type E3 ubiquitin transferase n=1 Tax=Glomus cerebriforme TaxID=658196 RepID=A0A397T7Y1_9GLOM|nr:hypothetical protein C1645_691711 [Glomus cerebriforme]